MSQTISHATLSDRFAAGQHDIPSITGLDSALAVLAKSDHEVRGYAYDAMHASHSSVHHASVAVAEAAYIESILKRLKDYQGDLDKQQAQITELVTAAEAYIETMDGSVAAAEQAQVAAECAKVEAEDAACRALSAQNAVVASVTEAATQVTRAVTAAAEAKQAALDVSDVVTQAKAIADGISTSVESATMAAQSAASSAAAAESAAIDAKNDADAVSQVAIPAIERAAQATEAAQTIVDAAQSYVISAQSAKVSADEAAESAASATQAATNAAASETVAKDAAVEAQRILDQMSEAVEGTMHFRGNVQSAGCLAPTADSGDIWYCIAEKAFYLYRIDHWTVFSSLQNWATTGTEVPEDISGIQEGGHVTVLDSGVDPKPEPQPKPTTGVLTWIGTVESLPAGEASTPGDTCVFNGLVYTYTGTEWSVLTNVAEGKPWALYASSISEDEIAAVVEALQDGGTLTVYHTNSEVTAH